MTGQRLFHAIDQQTRVGGNDEEPAGAASRLPAARAQLAAIHATADAVSHRLRYGDSARFLNQVVQSAGQ